jgi:hypothetical protein
MIQRAYGKDVLLKAQVFRCHKAFREGREYVKDEKHTGSPSTSHTSDNVARVKAVGDSDRRLKKRVARVHLETTKTWVLHHDNEASHVSLLAGEFLAK